MAKNPDLKALFLNCTLKKSPDVSNTQVLIDKVADLMRPQGVECETVRLADYKIPFGVESDMGDGDEWPKIYEKIKAADILVPSMPIWRGGSGSSLYEPHGAISCQRCRMDGPNVEGAWPDPDESHQTNGRGAKSQY
jgi:hypothetical protein